MQVISAMSIPLELSSMCPVGLGMLYFHFFIEEKAIEIHKFLKTKLNDILKI